MGRFLPDVPFDPLRYGMPPSSLPSIEPAQLLALEVARAALDDAGYAQRPFPRERPAVVLGMGGGAAQVAMGYAFRSYLPMLDSVIPGGGTAAMERCQGLLPEWTEDSFPGFLLNVTAGRIANRLDLGGANYTVDAACGSSLAALDAGRPRARNRRGRLVVLGGVDTVQNPFTYLAFSKTQAFSPRGPLPSVRRQADGIVISEGVAAVILKRLADAERDGDRIYAVIQGVGASSDGRAAGLTAPEPRGPGARAWSAPTPRRASIPQRSATSRLTAPAPLSATWSRSRRSRELFQSSGGGPGTLCGRFGQVADRPHQVRGGSGRADQRHAGPAASNDAADDRHQPPRIRGSTSSDGALRLSTRPSPGCIATSISRAGLASARSGSAARTSMRCWRPTRRTRLRRPSLRLVTGQPSCLSGRPRTATGLLRDLDRLSEQLAAGRRPPLRELGHALAARLARPLRAQPRRS